MNDITKERVIISMTSFPAAIKYAEQSIETILKGTVLPDKIIINLVLSNFEDKNILNPLQSLSQRYPIVVINDCPIEYHSYLKLIPTLKLHPNDIIVTVDDDIVYPPDMLERLLKTHRMYPEDIIAMRCKLVDPEKPYRFWKKFRRKHSLLKRRHKNPRIMQTGVSGVLYPPNSLKKEMLDPELFTQIAPTADDIWFWAAAIANNRYVTPVPFADSRVNELPKPAEISLKTTNFKGGSDKNFEALMNILTKYPSLKDKIYSGKNNRWL